MLKMILGLVLLLPTDVADLVKRLGDDRSENRDSAERELEEAGESALEALDNAGQSGDSEVAARARRVADRIRLDLELKKPHGDRASWERLFAGVKRGSSVAAANVLAGRASAFGELGQVCSGMTDGVDFHSWRLDATWMFWIEVDRGFPDAVKVAQVVGLEDLKAEFKEDWDLCRAIHESSSLGLGFDPASCILAVNALQAAGKDRALAAARRYVAVTRENQVRRAKHDLEPDRLFAILRLLFTDAAGKPFLPVPKMGVWTFAPAADALPGTFPILVVDDIPFMVSDFFRMSGVPEQPDDHLQRCENGGVLRAKPLAPSVTPLEAADRLLAGKEWKALKFAEGFERATQPHWIRLQAVRALTGSEVEVQDLRRKLFSESKLDPVEIWSAVCERLRGGDCHWSAATGKFEKAK